MYVVSADKYTSFKDLSSVLNAAIPREGISAEVGWVVHVLERLNESCSLNVVLLYNHPYKYSMLAPRNQVQALPRRSFPRDTGVRLSKILVSVGLFIRHHVRDSIPDVALKCTRDEDP